MLKISEKELQDRIIQLIQRNELISSIGEQQQLKRALKADAHEEHTPGYEIDFHLQTSYNQRARRVLDTLSGATLITGADIQNISLQPDTSDTRERLYPDILLGNKDNSSFVLIEIKKDSQSEREAVTELMAYALEIKNHLPQIADSDIHLILLSTTFNTLLTHSFCSLLLGTRFSLLALKATPDRDTLNLHIHFPDSWTDIWQKELPPHALSSISILAYESRKKKAVEDPHQLHYILQDLAVSEGNKNQSNGCLLIWENVSPSRKEMFGVTIYQINSFAFLDAISPRKRLHLKQNPLHAYIRQREKSENGYTPMESLVSTAEAIRKFLERYYRVRLDDCSTWTNHMQMGSEFRSYAYPVAFNSWGTLGEFIRYFYFHPSMKNRFYAPQQIHSTFFYNEPLYGIDMINLISGLHLFRDGIFGMRSLYHYANKLIHYLQILLGYMGNADEGREAKELSALLFYTGVEMMGTYREIFHRVASWKHEPEYMDQFPLYIQAQHLDWDSGKHLIEHFHWFKDHFLKEKRHKELFSKFFEWSLFFTPYSYVPLTPEAKKKIEEEVSCFVRQHLIAVWTKEIVWKTGSLQTELLALLGSTYFNGDLPPVKSEEEIHQQILSLPESLLIESFEGPFMEILYLTLPEVFHELNPLADSIKDVDWDQLRHHLIKRFQEGYRYGAIYIASNGEISTEILDHRSQKEFFLPIEDPEKEVFLVLNESGYIRTERTTWEKLKSGKAFR